MDMIFGVFLGIDQGFLKGIILQFFSKYSTSYINLNVKNFLKLSGT